MMAELTPILRMIPNTHGTCIMDHWIEWVDGYPAKICSIDSYIGIDWTLFHWLALLPILRAAEQPHA